MSNNQFTGDFLPTIGLSSLLLALEYLDFSSNNFGVSNATTIPELIGQLSQLQGLLLTNNGITGTLPSTLGGLPFI
jgi:Ran GTPase-activating protein (RanGAP) involved in mRNA processing and transport